MLTSFRVYRIKPVGRKIIKIYINPFKILIRQMHSGMFYSLNRGAPSDLGALQRSFQASSSLHGTTVVPYVVCFFSGNVMKAASNMIKILARDRVSRFDFFMYSHYVYTYTHRNDSAYIIYIAAVEPWNLFTWMKTSPGRYSSSQKQLNISLIAFPGLFSRELGL